MAVWEGYDDGVIHGQTRILFAEDNCSSMIGRQLSSGPPLPVHMQSHVWETTISFDLERLVLSTTFVYLDHLNICADQVLDSSRYRF